LARQFQVLAIGVKERNRPGRTNMWCVYYPQFSAIAFFFTTPSRRARMPTYLPSGRERQARLLSLHKSMARMVSASLIGASELFRD
jgi:hypothetical protein